ncbi:Rrf2 family transcriptional regulator [Xenorhabdus stockiae]|uniref:Rrf2 family transcriptional regulator n=1 Tax=Xenorhabdus stockiae TaxID=351614 RepID=UPI004063AD57
MKIVVVDENRPDVRWEYQQNPKSGRMAVKWIKDGTQDKIIAILQEALEEANHQRLLVT